jgi:hypothetical protein
MSEENPTSPLETTSAESTDLAPLNIIRSETVLSKLPIHNLSKKGKVDINIVRKNEKGEVELKWEVSYSDRYGQARQLAYKLDSVVINRRIDEERRPLPEIIRLGSLREVCQMLDLNTGQAIRDVKKALFQNAFAAITANLKYKSVDGTERTLEAGFTRYSVVFTGERLPNGKKADAVYIVLNGPYRDVLNNAPVRPLNYDYLKALNPSAQRFYEIISYRVYAALKHRQPYARLSYSDYCTFSAQQRYFDYDHFKKQMYKVHLPHKQSGYLAKAEYEETTDADGQVDWMMIYTPGPKAKAEYAAFTKQPHAIDIKTKDMRPERVGERSAKLEKHTPSLPAEQQLWLEEMTKRGIAESGARKILSELAEHQPVLDQLEYGDHLIKTTSINNPPGFYLYLLKENITVPEDFETSRKRQLREESHAEQERTNYEQAQREQAYEDYRHREINHYIESHPEEYAQVFEERRRRFLEKYPKTAEWDPAVLESTVRATTRTAIAENYVSVYSFEAFCALQYSQQSPTALDTAPVHEEQTTTDELPTLIV